MDKLTALFFDSVNGLNKEIHIYSSLIVDFDQLIFEFHS